MFPLMMQGAMNIPDCKLIWWDPWLPDQMLGSRKSSILDWDFPWNTPSSYWGTPIKMETPKSIIAVQQANMAQRIWYSTCCRRFSTPAMLRVRVLWNCARRSMSKRWPVFLVVFMVEWNMATMATMATTEAFRVWKTWNWNSPFQFVMISCIRIAVQVTFDSYLYKTVQGNDPVGDLKLGWKTLSSLYKYKNQKTPDPMRTLV